jgi:ElaB/YqjD/DUF883 family membrane-anchored ribosome-binding protein
MASVAEKAAEVTGKLHHLPHAASVVADCFEEGVETAKRVGKKTSDATEELMDDTANRVKRHPVESLVTAFAIGFILGGFVDWLTRRK